MWDSHLVAFRRQGPLVQLVALNTRYFAQPKTPQARGVRESFSDSLLASVPVRVAAASRAQVGADRGQRAAARRHSRRQRRARAHVPAVVFVRRPQLGVVKARSTPELTSFNVNAHYALARVTQPPATPGPVPATPLPATRARHPQPVPRLVLQLRASCPSEPMAPRAADDRVGYFATWRFDYTNDKALTPRVNYIERWRLEKKDPAAVAVGAEAADRLLARPQHSGALSRDGARRRARMEQGVRAHRLQGRAAGEDPARRRRLGHPRRAARVDALDDHRAAGVRRHRPAPGRSAQRRNPRRRHRHRSGAPARPPHPARRAVAAADRAVRPGFRGPAMPNRRSSAQELDFALDLLEARGEIEPDSPEAEPFVLEDLKDVVIHEVGHALGLRHNFRASTVYTQAQLNDPEFTALQRHRRLGDGVPGDQHRAARRDAGRVLHDDHRPLRLLGDRVRLQADRRPRTRPRH